MKTAIYIEDGVVQLVLTPESKFEQDTLASFQSKGMTTKILQGSFYTCQGGWARHNTPSRDDRSLIIRVENTQDPHVP